MEAWFTDAHGPTYALDCDFANASVVSGGVVWVHDFTVIMVVARKGMSNIPDLPGNRGRNLLRQDVLILIATSDTNGVWLVVLEVRCFGWVLFAERSAWSAFWAVQGYVAEQYGRKLRL